MNLFFIFSIILSTIVISIFFQKLVHSPILVGLIFFSVFLLIASITQNTTFIILAVILAVIAFISALIECLISQYGFFRNNNCIRIGNNCNNDCNNISENNNNNENQRLTILNSNGEIVARINGDNITCTSNTNQNNNETMHNSCRKCRNFY